MSNAIVQKKAIEDYFENYKPRYEKGKDAVYSGHIMDCRVDRELGMLWGVVQASQRTTIYNVKVHFITSKVLSGICSCPIGLHGKCHHIAALLHYAQKNISCTDTACMWSFKKKAGHGNEGQPIDVFYPPSKPNYKAVPGPLSAEEVKEARKGLQNCMGAAAGLKWLTDPEPSPLVGEINEHESCDSPEIPSVQKLVLSPGFQLADDKIVYCQHFFNLSDEDIEQIAKATEGQNNNPLWHLARQHRVTASVIGRVIRASTSNRSCASLINQIVGNTRSLDGIKAIDWGRDHEESAVEEFVNKFPEKKVMCTGIWLDKVGVSGASPDRLCDDNAIIEVKCPYSMRNAVNLEEELAMKKHEKYFIAYSNGICIMSDNHDYYHQVQAQLSFTGRSICYFLIWCPQDMLIVPIEKNELWREIHMPYVYSFYFDKYLPSVFSNEN